MKRIFCVLMSFILAAQTGAAWAETLTSPPTSRRFTVEMNQLKVTPPVFDAAAYGYSQPAAKSIVIENDSGSEVTGVNVSVDEADLFTIGGGGSTIPASSSINTWTVQPNADLPVGTHNAMILVGSDNGNGKVYAVVISFTVTTDIAQEAPIIVPDDPGDGDPGDGDPVVPSEPIEPNEPNEPSEPNEPGEVVDSPIVSDPADCELVYTKNADGTVDVLVLLPLAPGVDPSKITDIKAFLHEGIEVLGAISYAWVSEDGTVTPITLSSASTRAAEGPYLQISFIARSLDGLKAGSIAKLEYRLEGDETAYTQTFGDDGLSFGEMRQTDETPGPGGSSGAGCDAGVSGLFGAVLLCGALALKRSQKRG